MTLSPRQEFLDRLHRLIGTAPGRALEDHRRARLVVNTMFRALAGRYPDARERASIVRQAVEGASFDDLVAQVATTEAAVDRTLDRIQPLVQTWLRLQFERPRPGPRRPGSERVVFLHIMKTGGVSVSDACLGFARLRGPAWAGLYADDLLLRPPAMLAQARFLGGHLPYEALDVIPGTFRTATVLRDPVARAVSHYLELRRTAPSYEAMSLEEFADSGDPYGPSGNYQARQLAHRVDIAGAWITYNPYERLQALSMASTDYPVSGLFDTVPVEGGEDEVFKRARANLAAIDFVGVTETLGKVVEPIARIFGARPPVVPHLHASPLLGPEELSPSLRRRLEARTEMDRELYELARQQSG